MKKVIVEVVQKNLDAEFQNTMVMKALPIVRQEVDRFRSVVIFGLDEEKNELSYKRNEGDKLKVRSLLDAVNMRWAEREIVSTFRIGRFSKIRRKPRAIRITFSRDDIQKVMLARTHKLRNIRAFKTVYVRRDKSIREREFRRETVRAANPSENTTEVHGESFFLGIGKGGYVRPLKNIHKAVLF